MITMEKVGDEDENENDGEEYTGQWGTNTERRTKYGKELSK